MLQLPLSVQTTSPPAVFTDLGQGQLRVTQVALTLDQVAHIWLPHLKRMQPSALFEVAPIQLTARQPNPPAPPP